MNKDDFLSAAQNDLIVRLGIDKLPPEEQEEKIARIEELFWARISDLLLLHLGPEKAMELARLEQANDEQGIQELLDEHMPDFQSLLAEEAERFISEIEEDMAAAQ